MKFIISTNTLLKELQGISGVLSSNATLPILDHFLFRVENKQLIASASDLETTVINTIALDKADKDGAVCVPAKILLDILKTLPEQPVTFSVDEDKLGIVLSSETGNYKLSGQPADDFPKVPVLESPEELVLESRILYSAIDKTLFAAGNDDMRPVMSGVFFELGKDQLTFVATDAHKLVRYGRADLSSKKNASYILPRKPCNLLKSALTNSESEVKVEYTETNAHFTIENMSLICRLIDGKYPNYDAVIPKENPNVMTIDREAFLASVKRVSIFSNKTTHQVRLKIAGSELSISAEDLDFSNEANERLTCNYDGEDIEIGFNSRFLGDMLSNLQSDNVQLAMSAPNRAGLLTPADGTDEGEDILMLVMPVMLNNN